MNINNTKRNCIIVARVSSREQDEIGYSLPSQLKLLIEYADRQGFIIKHKFDISETASKQEQRKKFNQMLKLAVQDKVDIIIFEKVDRVTRSIHSSVDIYNWLDSDENRQLHCVKDSLVLHKYSRSQDKLNWDIKVAMAKNYADNLSEEVRKGKKEKIEQGWYPGSAPIGYKSVDALGSKRKITVIDTTKSPLVKMCFELFVSGKYSIETLTKKMNDEGLRNKRGNKLVKSGMHELLRNPFYYGAFIWNKKLHTHGKHEPIISKELFDRVQQTLTRKPDAKYSKHFYMLKGLVRCEECGGPISWSEKKGHVYGRCNHYRECNQSVCGREDYCDNVVVEALQSLKVQSPRLKEWIKKSLQEGNKDQEEYVLASLSSLNEELNKIVRKQSKLYDDRLEEIISLDTYKVKNVKFEEEKSSVESKIIKLNQDTNKYFQIGTLVYLVAQYADEIYGILDPEEISGVMKYIFSDITLFNGEMSYKYTEPFKVLKKAVERTNKESSKQAEKPELAKNIFEPAITIEKTIQSELSEAVRTEIRRDRDSNPRPDCSSTAFRGQRYRPLSHLSIN